MEDRVVLHILFALAARLWHSLVEFLGLAHGWEENNLTPNEHKQFRESHPPSDENALIEYSSSPSSQDVEERDFSSTEDQVTTIHVFSIPVPQLTNSHIQTWRTDEPRVG